MQLHCLTLSPNAHTTYTHYLTLHPKMTSKGICFDNIIFYYMDYQKQTPKGFSKAAADRLK